MTRRPGRSHTAGFTLLELLVAITLLGLLSLIVTSGLRYASAAWRISQLHSDQASTITAAHALIERLLTSAQATYASADRNDPRLDFAGTADALTFVAPLPQAVDPGIMARQRLALAPAPHGATLSLSWRLDLPAANPNPPPAATAVLLESVRSLHLRYWGASASGAPPAWQDTWQDQPRLPELISIEIDLADSTALALMVAPRITVSPACVYHPIGPVCRRP